MTEGKRQLRVLIIEDNASDAELVVAELRRGGFRPEWTRVDSEAFYVDALTPPPDLILADYTLPSFSAPRALEILIDRQLDVPFIVVTGSVGEAPAIECLKKGAADYLLKDRMARLPMAVERALHERELRETKRRSDAALRESRAYLQRLLSASPAIIYAASAVPPFEIRFMSENVFAQLGYTPAECFADARFWIDGVHPDDAARAVVDVSAVAGEIIEAREYRFRHKDGTYRWMRDGAVVLRDHPGGAELVGYWIDVTERKRAEAAVYEHERYFRRLIEHASDVIAVLDAHGTVLYETPSLERWTGFRPVDLIGTSAFDIVHPDDRERIEHLFLSAIGTQGAVASAQFRHRHRDGSWRDFEAVGTPVVDDNGVITGAIVNGRDVTDRVRVEAERREFQERFRLMFEHAAVGIAQISLDGRFVEVNDRLCQILGYSRQDLVQRKLGDLVDPEDSPALDGDVFECRARRGDGATIWLAGRTSYTHRGDGDPTFGVAIIMDVTNRRLAEDAVQKEQVFRNAIEHSMRAGVGAFDPTGRLTYVNPALCRMVGWGAEDLLGTLPPYVFFAPDQVEPLMRAMKEARATGRAPEHGVESQFVNRNGERFDVLILPSPMEGADGAVTGWVTSIYDISDRKRLEERLRQAQKMEAIGRLAGGIAHDFNNLLTAILGYSELLLDQTPESEAARTDLQEIHRAGESAAALTRQLLAFSRRQVLEPEVIDANEIVGDMAKILRRTIGEDVTLTTRLAPTLRPVIADRGQLEQVLMNLSVNARDAMPKGGTLTISTSNVDLPVALRRGRWEVPPGRYVLLSIADTGTGMSADVLSHLFEPFFTTKPRGRGTGLGLPTVYGIVSQSGGYVTVDSELLSGTTMSLYLPAALGPSAETTRESVFAASRGTETILVAEDDAVIRGLSTDVLRAHGYGVLAAASGKDAVDIADTFGKPIDVLLTDVVMPGMSGVEVAEALRARQPNMKCIYMSGYTDDALIRHGLATGGFAFLQKPFTPARLLQKIRETLERSRPVTPGSSS